MGVVTARTAGMYRGAYPVLILPADPNRTQLLVKASFLPLFIADNIESLTTELMTQQARYLSTFTKPVIFRGYTGPLYARTASFIPHATLQGFILVHSTSKGNKK